MPDLLFLRVLWDMLMQLCSIFGPFGLLALLCYAVLARWVAWVFLDWGLHPGGRKRPPRH